MQDEQLAEILNGITTIAVVGYSANPQRPSHRVARYLQERGYDVYPVNPRLLGQEHLGRPVHADLASIPVAIDMVDVFRRPEHLLGVVAEALAVNAGLVWTQLDVVNEEAQQLAVDNGLPTIVDRCPAIEIPRLVASGLMQ
jgi:predicted CoA-binding protein